MNIFLTVVCLTALCAMVGCSPPIEALARRQLPALQHEEVHDELGQFALRYVTAEGTVVSERGRLVPSGDSLVLVTDGEVSYVSDDGRTYVTKFHAGLDGFQVEGDHLPKLPTEV